MFFAYNVPFDSARVIKFGDITANYICLPVLNRQPLYFVIYEVNAKNIDLLLLPIFGQRVQYSDDAKTRIVRSFLLHI